MAEYIVGGGWGNAIEWSRPEQFSVDNASDTLFTVHGWKSRIPEIGDTLKAEFLKSWKWFTFVTVKPCDDPPDMFFAEVRCIRQEMKEQRQPLAITK